MLCDWNTHIEGHPNPARQSRCNLEGYGGLDYEVYGDPNPDPDPNPHPNPNPNPNPNRNPNPSPNPHQVYGNQTAAALAAMPGGRCPLPPGDVPGGGLGFDREGHWVGEEQGAPEMARLRRLERER